MFGLVILFLTYVSADYGYGPPPAGQNNLLTMLANGGLIGPTGTISTNGLFGNTGTANGLHGNTGSSVGTSGAPGSSTGTTGTSTGAGSLAMGNGCRPGQSLDKDGKCVMAEVTRNMFLFDAPEIETYANLAALKEKPKLHYNYVFVRTPSLFDVSKAFSKPASKQKTLVYVLTKKPTLEEQRELAKSQKPVSPEVFFVNYNDGENLNLPGGVSLEEALSQSSKTGQVVNTGANLGGALVNGGNDINTNVIQDSYSTTGLGTFGTIGNIANLPSIQPLYGVPSPN